MARLPPGVRDKRKRDFAEELWQSNGDVAVAAATVGIAFHTGITYLNEMKRAFGWQAK